MDMPGFVNELKNHTLQTGIPKYFYEVLSARSLDDGLLGRYLFIDADGFLPFAERTETPLPESVIAAAKMLIARESLIA